MHSQNLKDFVSISIVMSCLTLTAWTFRENQRLVASVPAPCAAPASPQTTYAPTFSLQLSWPQAASPTAETRPFHPSQLSPAEPWLGVTAARRTPGLLAVWSTKMVQRSEDDGATYQTVLAGEDEIREVVFDDAGNLFVIRGERLGVYSVKGKEFWKALAGPTIDLVAGAKLVWLGYKNGADGEPGAGILAVSTDKGKTWETQQSYEQFPGPGTYHNQLYLSRTDELFFMKSSEAGCGGGSQSRYKQLSDGTWEELPWSLDTYGEFQLGAGGFAYGPSTCGTDAETICAAGSTAEVKALSGIHLDAGEPWKIATNDKQSFLFFAGALYSLQGEKNKELLGGIPKEFSLQAVDAEGRALGVLFGKVLRWSPTTGWSQLR